MESMRARQRAENAADGLLIYPLEPIIPHAAFQIIHLIKTFYIPAICRST